MNLQDLHKPFPPSEIEWRVGSTNGDKTSGLALAYLNARHVMERLDAIVGPENWQDRYEVHGSKTICYLSICTGSDVNGAVWVTKADGAGDSDVEAEKGAISDALKRAAVKWGIGRYLYTLGSTWVDIEPAGKSVRIKKDQYAKLERILQQRFGMGLEAAPEAQQGETSYLDDALAKKLFPLIQNELFAATTTKQLEGVWSRWLPLTSQFDDQTENGMGTTVAGLYDELRRNLEEKGGDIRSEGREAIEASLRAAMSMDDLQDRWMKSGPAMKKLAAKDVTYLSGVKDTMKGVIQEMAVGAELARAEKAVRLAGTP